MKRLLGAYLCLAALAIFIGHAPLAHAGEHQEEVCSVCLSGGVSDVPAPALRVVVFQPLFVVHHAEARLDLRAFPASVLSRGPPLS